MTAVSTPKRTGFVRRMGAIMNRAISQVSYRLHVAAANTWRDGYNPLRSLTIMRAVHLLEEGERGAMADLQWTYRYIEMQDATLGALVERRTSAIQELDWDIKTKAEIPQGKEEIAKRQAAALKEAYGKISNLSAAFELLAMASFRGFARLEKVTDESGDIIELAPVDQWFWVRQGIYGAWKLNTQATFGTNTGEDVPEPRFVTREVARPINRVALIAFVRKGLSQKDWDAFIETYGVPAVFVVMPESVVEDKEEEFLELADQVVGDARGVLPHGSDIKTVDNGARGVNPFKDHIAYQDEQVVLRGTGGKLTMLAESGSGTLAGGAHSETFRAIARADAAEISEILRKCIDQGVLDRVTPGEECYAYFELSANEETDPSAITKDVVSLENAGLEVDAKWLEEKTGYRVTRKAVALPKETLNLPAPDPILNRVPGVLEFSRMLCDAQYGIRAENPLLEQILNRDGGEVWKRFARETGTLGIPREIMPQIQSGNRAAMVNKLRAHGVDYSPAEVKPADLKPTQAEWCPAKVEKARQHEGPQRSLLVSSDNHVVDGHHQWMASLQDAPNTPIPVFRIHAPIMHVLGIILQMSSTGTAPMPIRNRTGSADYEELFVSSLAKAVGVQARTLDPIGSLIDGKLQGLVLDGPGRIDDAQFLQLVEEAAEMLPELFDPEEAASLARDLEGAMGTAALIGLRDSLRKPSIQPKES